MLENLCKIFYSNHKAHQQAYLDRFNSPSAVHLPFKIKQFNHNKEFQAFFYYHQDLSLLTQNIYSEFSQFINILDSVPAIVQQQFALSCVIDEVHSTSSIEGIHSTHRELKDILDCNNHSAHFSSIIKKYEMLMSGSYPQFLSCLDIRTFYDGCTNDDIIADNPNNRLDGILFRKEAADVLSPSGKTIHRGITPEDKLIQILSYALDFLNDKTIPALVRIAAFHYMFVYIHPFYDGNGRTARFISSCYIAKHLHPLIALRLAVTIKKRQKLYYSMLKETDAECNCGDFTPFIYGFLTFILKTISGINRKLSRKISQIKRFRASFDTLFHSILMDLLLQASAFYGRGLSMDEIMSLTSKSRNTIKSKFRSLPVRVVIRQKKKFYKIDWTALRITIHR